MGLGASNGFLPDQTPVFQVDTGNHEAEDPFGIDVVVCPRGLLGNGKRIPLGNGSGQEDVIPPNDWAGMSPIRERDFPTNVLGFVPVERGRGMRCFTGCERASPLGPKVESFRLGL